MKRTTYDGFLTKADAPQVFTKANGETGELVGYASKWWEIDSYGECTAPGSFARSITERGPGGTDRILFRYEHMTTCGRHAELSEDETGLRIKAVVSDDGQDGTRLRRHLKDGIKYGLSIGFRYVRQRPGTPDDPFVMDNAPGWLFGDGGQFNPAMVTVLEEVKLLENSAVSFPAVDTALIDGYRADTDITQRAIDRLLLDLKRGSLTDAQLLQLRALAQSLPAASDPDPEMGAPVTPQTAVTRRNYLAEARLALASAGVPLWE